MADGNIKLYGKLKSVTEEGKVADYSEIAGVPIIMQDLSASGFTPTANTYYLHIGETTIMCDKGTIYFYNGTEYKVLGSGGSNVGNGSGQGSIIQKNVKSSSGEPYTNVASGPASIAFGKNTKALGNTDFVIGQNNTSDSSGSFVGGINCNNTDNSNYSFVFGDSVNNQYATKSFVFGTDIQNSAGNSFVVGNDITNPIQNAFLIGRGLRSQNYLPTDSEDGITILGRYNKRATQGEDADGTILIIGNGTSDTNRSNAVKLSTANGLESFIAPKTDYGVVRKIELDDLSNKYLPAVKATAVDYAVTTKVIFTGQTEVQNLTGVKCLSFSSTGNMGYIAKNNNVFQFPAQTGTFLLRPNDLPTETSLVTVSSTGTHAYKKVSELATLNGDNYFTNNNSFDKSVIIYDELEVQKDIFVGDARIVSTCYSDGYIRKDWDDGGGNFKATKLNIPLLNATYYFAITPNSAPTEPSVVVNAVDRTPTWKPASELGGNALKVTVW